MTTFSSSRFNVATRLIGFPFIVAAFAIRAAYDEVRNEVSALRTDFVPAVRYVVTGDSDKGVVAHAGDKARSLRERVSYVFEEYAADRLLALFFLLAMPFLVIYGMYVTLKDEGFFADVWDAIVGCVKAVITGNDPTTY